MALSSTIKKAIGIAGRIDQKYNVNKIFVNKYVPPGYRKYINKIFDIAGTVSGGYGLYSFIESLYAPDTPGNGGTIPFKKTKFKTGKSYQARRRRPKCPSRRRRRVSSSRGYY